MRLEELEELLRPFACSTCGPACANDEHPRTAPAMPALLRKALPLLIEVVRTADKMRVACSVGTGSASWLAQAAYEYDAAKKKLDEL